MMSLLNLLQSEDPAVQNGLLNFGLSLMRSKGNFGNAVGQAGVAGQLGARDYRQQQALMSRTSLNDELIRNQLEQQQHMLAMQKLPQQFIKPPSAPGVDATGGMETAMDNPNNAASAGGFDMGGYINALAGMDPIAAIRLRESLTKSKPAPIISKPGDVARDPETGAQLWANPEKPDKLDDPLSKLIAARDALPLGHPNRSVYDAAIRKASTHAPAASNSVVNYAAPVPFLQADGTIGYAQPGNRAGAPPQIMTDPATGKPLVKPVDAKDKDLTEAQSKATAYLGQMRSASKALEAVKADQTDYAVQAETMMAGGPINLAVGQKAQRVRQAQDQWSEAFLRFKTGAASTPAEVASNNATFFPKFGDKPEQVKQKKAMREQAERDMEIAAGRGTAVLNKRDGVGTETDSDPLGLRK